MRIGIVTQFPFPQSHDQRARQLAKTLALGGHNVTVFTPLATDSDLDGHGIAIRMPDGPKLLRKPLPFNEYWRRWLTSQGNQLQIDCFISKQLRLATSTWMAARRLGARFCVDLSENYPAMVQVEREGQILLPAFKHMARFLEVFCARRADMVIVVTESNRQRLIGLGVPSGTSHRRCHHSRSGAASPAKAGGYKTSRPRICWPDFKGAWPGSAPDGYFAGQGSRSSPLAYLRDWP